MADVREEILALIEENTTPEAPWVGRTYLREQIRKPAYDATVDDFDAAYEGLRADLEIVCWHGLTAVAAEEILRGAVKAAAEGSITQRVLIGKLNKIQAGVYEPPAEVER